MSLILSKKIVTESFLHFLWENKLFSTDELFTDDGLCVEIVHPGIYNTNAGPDFFNAKLKIDTTFWAGNVEIHLNSSEWIKHKHHLDLAYDSVILHVVYKNDTSTKRTDGSHIPTIEIKGRFSLDLWSNFLDLMSQSNWIACSSYLPTIDKALWEKVIEEKCDERLRLKTQNILVALNGLKGNWEECFYQQLAKNFGFNVNAIPFEMLARSLPLKLIHKERDVIENVVSLLFGQAGMLTPTFSDEYPIDLKERYLHLKNKYSLRSIQAETWKYMRMRPVNFPTIRIAQFASTLLASNNLFAIARDIKSKNELISLLQTGSVNEYWNNHYLFDKPSTKISKNIGLLSIHNLIINTFVPFQFAWSIYTNNPDYKKSAIQLLKDIPAEKNAIMEKWNKYNIKSHNSFQSQALLQLKQFHCSEKKCLTCAIGKNLISHKK